MANEIDLYEGGEVGPVNDQPLAPAPSPDSTDMTHREALPDTPDVPDGQILDPQAYQNWVDSVGDLPVGQAAEYLPGMQLPDGRVIRVFGMSGPHPNAKPARKSAMTTLLARAKK
ncbi:hypothetical protein [Pseudomonas izuensis]|uniref:hypothetical protein n=1 Tax=Pseudomonas izuensis TaxID=2684212 RepID=UPI0013594967|nr:hypothetical protein [Pseudomonas izuensis]